LPVGLWVNFVLNSSPGCISKHTRGQKCSNCEYRQTFQHDAGNVSCQTQGGVMKRLDTHCQPAGLSIFSGDMVGYGKVLGGTIL
jgi:hypothetical protein